MPARPTGEHRGPSPPPALTTLTTTGLVTTSVTHSWYCHPRINDVEPKVVTTRDGGCTKPAPSQAARTLRPALSSNWVDGSCRHPPRATPCQNYLHRVKGHDHQGKRLYPIDNSSRGNRALDVVCTTKQGEAELKVATTKEGGCTKTTTHTAAEHLPMVSLLSNYDVGCCRLPQMAPPCPNRQSRVECCDNQGAQLYRNDKIPLQHGTRRRSAPPIKGADGGSGHQPTSTPRTETPTQSSYPE